MNKFTIHLLLIAALGVLLAGCTANEPAPAGEIPETIKRSVEDIARANNISMEEAYKQYAAENPVAALQAELIAHESDTFAGLWLQHEPDERVVVAFTRNGKATIKPYLKNLSLPQLELRTAEVTYAELLETQQQLYEHMRALCLPFSTGVDVPENQVTMWVTDQALLESSLQQANLQLPEYVNVEVIFDPLSVKTPENLIPPVDIYFPKLRAQSSMYMTALMIGTLVEEDGCLRVNSQWGGEKPLIIWQTNYFLNDNNGTIEILDPNGTVLAREGEAISLGGGGVPGGLELECQLRKPIPAQCQGSYFLMGSIEK
jgi:hypothetical protein